MAQNTISLDKVLGPDCWLIAVAKTNDKLCVREGGNKVGFMSFSSDDGMTEFIRQNEAAVHEATLSWQSKLGLGGTI